MMKIAAALLMFAVSLAGASDRMRLITDPSAGDQTDADSFSGTFELLGVPVRRDPPSHPSLRGAGFICLPNAAAGQVPVKDRAKLLSWVRGGKVLLTDGASFVTEALGLKTAPAHPVFGVEDRLDKTLPLRWPDRPIVAAFDATEDDATRWLYVDSETAKPLALLIRYGKGRVVVFAGAYDDLTGQGYARYPDLPFLLVHDLNLRPPRSAALAEAYFDPGNRSGRLDAERLAAQWRRWGLRRVYAAAWYAGTKDPADPFDYGSLLKAAHRNGIAVDAWFEWPHVTMGFWDQNPDCREKTAALTDAHLDWRYLVNLDSAACWNGIAAEAHALLGRYPWDGVDVAEVYLEPVIGADAGPEGWTPMNAEARSYFQKDLGFDPMLLFQPGSERFRQAHPRAMDAFYTARIRLNTARVQRAVEFAAAEGKGRASWDPVLTFIDVSAHPEMGGLIGVDTPAHLDFAKRFGLTPQIEDPYTEWALGPTRYDRLVERYGRIWRNPYGVDINVVAAHDLEQAQYPTEKPAGTEFFQLWRAAYGRGNRVCVYAEDTVREMDWEVLPYVMGAASSRRP